MKKWIACLSAAALSLILLTALAVPALAAPVSLQLPVRVELKGKRPDKPETFRIRLEAVSDDAPMPEDRREWTLEQKGPGSGSFPELTFSHPMQVVYRVTQIPGTAEHYTYDPAVYQVEVTIASTAQGLFPEVVLTRTGQEEKAGELAFVNRYDPPARPVSSDNPKMGDEFPLFFWICLGSGSLMGAVLLSLLTFCRKQN